MEARSVRRLTWAASILLCIAGAYLSGKLTQSHIQTGYGKDSLLGRVCEEGTASCDEVIRSPWGTVLGLPTALWGLGYFVGLGLWLLLIGLPNRAGRPWHLLTIAVTAGGLAVAGLLEYVMWVQLPRWCPLCLATHVLSLALFAGAILMWPRKPRSPGLAVAPGPAEATAPVSPPPYAPTEMSAEASPRPGRVLMALVCILVAMVAVRENFLHRHHRAEETKAREQLAQARAALAGRDGEAASGRIPLRPDDPVAGDPGAPATLVVFSDFECPMCGGFAGFWKKEIEPYARGKVRLVFKYFPMNARCNPGVTTTLHEKSCESAEIAEAARRLGGNVAFWKIHDELFLNQLRGRKVKKLTPAELADKAGVDAARLEQERGSAEVSRRIQEDIEVARRLGVRATPVAFLDGRRVEMSGPDPVWQQFLASLRPPDSAPATQSAP